MTQRNVRILVALGGLVAVLAAFAIGFTLAGDDDGEVAADDTTTTTTTPDDTTTSTTAASTTTSTAAPSGPPMIVADGYVLGYWDGTDWVSLVDPDGTGLPDAPDLVGEPYRYLSLGADPIERPLGSIVEGCYLGNNRVVDDPESEGRLGLPVWIDPLPRPVETIAASAAHEDAVRQWLEDQGVDDPEVEIQRVTRTDLDGDGVDEVFIEAGNDDSGQPSQEAGAYSVVLYRHVVDDQAVTVEIAGDVVTEDELESELAFVVVHRLLAIADVNGDGDLEAVTDDRFYEGAGVSVLDIAGGDVERVLDTGCGA